MLMSDKESMCEYKKQAVFKLQFMYDGIKAAQTYLALKSCLRPTPADWLSHPRQHCVHDDLQWAFYVSAEKLWPTKPPFCSRRWQIFCHPEVTKPGVFWEMWDGSLAVLFCLLSTCFGLRTLPWTPSLPNLLFLSSSPLFHVFSICR